MAATAVAIHETIAAMRKAITRTDDASDSDESITQPTNRANKLKRKAHFVHEGRLNPPNGPEVYRKKAKHAGYERFIIYNNPPRYDEDGYELEADEIDQHADADAAEINPYATIKLEHLLRPLISAAELATHPSFSVPYYSNALPETVNQVGKMVRDEKASLWRMKGLLTKIGGDDTWAPCGIVETDLDAALFGPSLTAPLAKSLEGDLPEGVSARNQDDSNTEVEPEARPSIELNGTSIRTDTTQDNVGVERDERNGTDFNDQLAKLEKNNGKESGKNTPGKHSAVSGALVEGDLKIKSEEDQSMIDQQKIRSASEATTERADDTQAPAKSNSADQVAGAKSPKPQVNDATKERATEGEATQPALETPGNQEKDVEDEDTSESQPVAHRMRTRAQAQAASDNTMTEQTRSQSPASSDTQWIHPIFLIPESACPDRDLGLQPVEAEDVRRLMLSYVQKQEEIVRSAESLYQGLLKADRLRKTVLKWAKAESHVGEMSDGEDWYDKEEWGLDEELKKGHEEDEDDGNQGKKTRGRRN